MFGSETAAPAATTFAAEPSDFAAMLAREFKPKTERAREAVETAVQTLAEQALAHTALIADDSLRTIEAVVAAIDAKMTEEINEIMHHEDFQRMESAWRGLHYM